VDVLEVLGALGRRRASTSADESAGPIFLVSVMIAPPFIMTRMPMRLRSPHDASAMACTPPVRCQPNDMAPSMVDAPKPFATYVMPR
jgi:hypothetical protein